jgi:hypothetical protein
MSQEKYTSRSSPPLRPPFSCPWRLTAERSAPLGLRALGSGGLGRIVAGRKRLEGLKELQHRLAEYEELQNEGDEDAVNRLEDEIAELSAQMRLMEDEEPRLRELLTAADAVTAETKVAKVLSLLEGAFAGRPVLLFTGYKATQSLLMSALNAQFGDGCVTFINGDERTEEVADAAGRANPVRGRSSTNCRRRS